MLKYLGYMKLHLTFITMFGSRWLHCYYDLYVWHLRDHRSPIYFIFAFFFGLTRINHQNITEHTFTQPIFEIQNGISIQFVLNQAKF